MDLTETVTARIDAQTRAALERLAERFGCAVDHLVATAVFRFVNEEDREVAQEFADLPPFVSPDPLARALDEAETRHREAFDAFIQPGLDDIAAGRVIDHDDFMREMRERYRSRDAA